MIYLIPALLEVVKDWDIEVREELSENGFWFAPLLPESGEIDPDCREVNDNRVSLVQKNLKQWLNKVGLTERSPHKFRHGHIQYGVARAKTFADFKAISLNAMHSSIKITDEIYSNYKGDEVQRRIIAMGNTTKSDTQNEQELIQKFLDWQRNNDF